MARRQQNWDCGVAEAMTKAVFDRDFGKFELEPPVVVESVSLGKSIWLEGNDVQLIKGHREEVRAEEHLLLWRHQLSFTVEESVLKEKAEKKKNRPQN